jgi:hypothetical protein
MAPLYTHIWSMSNHSAVEVRDGCMIDLGPMGAFVIGESYSWLGTSSWVMNTSNLTLSDNCDLDDKLIPIQRRPVTGECKYSKLWQ